MTRKTDGSSDIAFPPDWAWSDLEAKNGYAEIRGIFAHLTQGLTTAFIKGLHSWSYTAKRRPLVYGKIEFMIAILYFVDEKLTLP
jgi:hypothetical protein